MDRGAALDGRRHLDRDTVMAIAQDRQIRLGRQREQGMLHAGQIILGQSVKDIAGEKIRLHQTRRDPRPAPPHGQTRLLPAHPALTAHVAVFSKG